MAKYDKSHILFLINETELLLNRLRCAVEGMEPPGIEVALPPQPVSPEMTAGEVALELNLRNAEALYCGDCNTGHLRQIKRGRKLFWHRAQVVRHREIEYEKGSCDGSCEAAITPLRAVG